jgi:hypothetical protein
MSTHTQLLEQIRRLASSPDNSTFIIGWCLAGASEPELIRLRDALVEFDSQPDRQEYVRLLAERYNGSSRLS